MKRLKGRKLASFASGESVIWTEASEHDDGFAPTDAMKAEAVRGLDWREEYGRGGTEIGVARARDISNGRRLSADTVRRMASYFARHEVDKQGKGWSPGEDGYPSAGRIAWALWGGDPGRTWANRIVERLDAATGDRDIVANEDGGGDATESNSGSRVPRFSMIAYTGGAMRVSGWDAPVVVDLAGLQWTVKSRPILKDHSSQMPVGHTTAIRVDGSNLIIEGMISSESIVANEIVASSRNGFPWQASIGADAGGIEYAGEGETLTANGREFAGPVYVSRRAQLGEVSFVALGADDDTNAKVAATYAANDRKEPKMDKSAETGDVRAAAEQVDTGAVVAQIREAAAVETARIASIRKTAADHADIAATAISEGWDTTRTELEVLRAERAQAAPAAIVKTASEDVGDTVIEAALAKTGRLPQIERHFDEKTLDAADNLRNLGIEETLLNAARRNGYSGRSLKADTRGVLQAAFATMSLPGIFSNVANKFLLSGFDGVDQVWRRIASIRSVSDFKTVTSYRLSGAFAFDEIGAGGEIKNGEVSEETYSNAAKTYAKMFSVTREDLINDDLGALSALPSRIGRGAALKLNSVFWTAFHDTAAFFTAGNKNLVTGSALGGADPIESLTTAEVAFMDQVDPDGYPIAITPAMLLVPHGLYAKATSLMNSAEVRNPSGGKEPIGNPHNGKFEVVTTPYLSSSAISGSSATSWYLLANPGDMSMLEVCFLNGTETPTVESADADFNVLGIQMRGFFDFGVALQDHRAAVKATA